MINSAAINIYQSQLCQKKEKKCLFFVLIFLTFFYVFSPPIRYIPFGPDKLVGACSYFYIFFFCRQSLLKILRNNSVRIFIFVNILLLAYCTIIYFYSDNNILDFIYNNYHQFFLTIPVAFAFSMIIINNYDDPIESSFRILIWVTIIQAIITALLILNQDFNYQLYGSFYRVRVEDKILDYEISRQIYRGFGIGQGFLFSFPIIMGLLSIVLMFNFLTKSPIRLIFLVLILPAIIFNARTGFVPVFVGTGFLSFFYLFYFRKSLLPTILVVLSIIIVIFSTDFILEKVMSEHYSQHQWTLQFFRQLPLLGQQSEGDSVYRHLLSLTYVPDGINFLIGEGYSAYFSTRLDVGYTNQFYYGGLIYFLLLIIPIIYILRLYYVYKISNFLKYIVISLLVSLFLCNFKGDVFSSYRIIATYYLITFCPIIMYILGACPKIHLLQKANPSKFETDSRAGKFFGE